MGFFDDSLLNTDAPSAKVPDGEYLLAISGLTVKVKSWPDDTQFRWDFRIKDGVAGHGQTLRMTTTLKPSLQFGLGRLLTAIGFDPAKLMEQDPKTEAQLIKLAEKLAAKVRDAEFGALVVESKPDDQGRRYSNIQETYAAADFAERSKSNVVARPTPAPAGARTQHAEEVEDLADEVDKW